jgi:head-tail adaptor
VQNRRKSAVGAVLVIGLGTIVTTSGCDEKKPNLAPVASSLAPSTAAAPGATIKKFTVDGTSKASIEMEAPKEKIKAQASGGSGTIDIDIANLANSRGEVKMDLATLATNTFGEQEKNTSQTVHARTWLEVADGESGKLDDKTKETNRWAVYAIRSIENPSATDLTKVAPTKDGADDVRTVTLTTKGELLVHGHKVERDADVEVAFHYDSGGAADKPKSLTIKTKKPFRVVLAEHDVKPRDGFGKLAKGSFHLLGTKVADNAEIGLDLRAKPQS